MRRSLVESLERRKDAMIAALWANSNWDDDKGTRKNAIEEIEQNYQEVVSMILGGKTVQEEEIDQDNPFFSAAARGVEKIQRPRNDEGVVREAIDYAKDIDQ